MDSFKAWLAQPFAANMSAGQWFLFFGLLLVIAMLWHMILQGFGVSEA
jgi:hypothetical protein